MPKSKNNLYRFTNPLMRACVRLQMHKEKEPALFTASPLINIQVGKWEGWEDLEGREDAPQACAETPVGALIGEKYAVFASRNGSSQGSWPSAPSRYVLGRGDGVGDRLRGLCGARSGTGVPTAATAPK